MTPWILASNGGAAFDILAWALTIALLTVGLYILVGITLLPVWGLGAVLHADRLARWGRGWWLLPWLVVERAFQLGDALTKPRDGSAYARSPEQKPKDAESRQSDWAQTLGRFVLWALAIVGGLVLFIEGDDTVEQPLAGSAAGLPVTLSAVMMTAAAAGAAWVLSRRYLDGSRPPLFRFFIAATLVLGLFSYSMIKELQYSDRMVADYCAYGSVSQAQLDGCESHVSANEVRSRDTPAARIAKSGSSDDVCGPDSGPLCQEVLDHRYMEDQVS